MNNGKKQTPDHAFREALQESIQGSRHARKFIARFVEALLKVRTSNLAKIALAIAGEAETASVYRQIQRYLKNENQVVIDYLKLLNLEGNLKILIDRTEWKFGETWVNILCLSVALSTSGDSIIVGRRQPERQSGGGRVGRAAQAAGCRVGSRPHRKNLG